jgi:serine/threonine protein kinase
VFTTKLYDVLIPPENEPLDRVFLVMQCIEQSLKNVFSLDTDSFSLDHVTIILYNLMCAINFIHTAGIVHRDIKPANILMNSTCVITLCDFGLARTIDTTREGHFETSEFFMKRKGTGSSTKEEKIFSGEI